MLKCSPNQIGKGDKSFTFTFCSVCITSYPFCLVMSTSPHYSTQHLFSFYLLPHVPIYWFSILVIVPFNASPWKTLSPGATIGWMSAFTVTCRYVLYLLIREHKTEGKRKEPDMVFHRSCILIAEDEALRRVPHHCQIGMIDGVLLNTPDKMKYQQLSCHRICSHVHWISTTSQIWSYLWWCCNIQTIFFYLTNSLCYCVWSSPMSISQNSNTILIPQTWQSGLPHTKHPLEYLNTP